MNLHTPRSTRRWRALATSDADDLGTLVTGSRPAPSNLLLSALTDPGALAGLPVENWDMLLRQARRARLLPRLALTARLLHLTEQFPDKLRDRLTAAAATGEHNARGVRWEVNRIALAVFDLDIPILLLKGAAYVLAELPPARGRLASDIDIMVPEQALEAVQAALERHGWEPMKLDPYDQQYYRRWMHELPPLQHRARGSVVDVHHTILPRTSRLRPDPGKLWREARKLPGKPFSVLSPKDMVLHSAAHLFHDGDLSVAIRDLVDISDLLTHFGANPDFWNRLASRARDMDLARPLFYALRYANLLLTTPIPDDAMSEAAAEAPSRAVLAVMDHLVPRVLLPGDPDRPSHSTGQAAMALYIRSHWLRMPPLLLSAHLIRKAYKRLTWREETEN